MRVRVSPSAPALYSAAVQPVSAIIPSRGDSAFLRAAIASAARGGAAEVVVALPEPIDPAPPCTVPLIQVPVALRRCSVGRNAAIRSASHARVALLDDDDLWLPGHVAALDALFDAAPDCPFVATRAAYFVDDSPAGDAEPPTVPCGPTVPPPGVGGRIGLPLLLLGNRVAAPAVAIDRARLPAGLALFDESRHVIEDYDLWLRLAEFGDLAVGEQVTVWVRRRPESDSSDARGMAFHSLDALARYEDRAAALVGQAAWDRRRATLWHELAWGELARGGGRAARRALREAGRLGDRRARHVFYWAASWLPAGVRAALMRARRAATGRAALTEERRSTAASRATRPP